MPSAPDDTTAPVPTGRWGLGDVAVGWLAGQVLAVVAFSAIASATGRTSAEMDELPIGLLLLAQLALWTGWLGVAAVATHRKGDGLVRELGIRARWSDLRGAPLGALLQLPLLPLLYWPLLRLLDKTSGDLEAAARELTDRVQGPGATVALVLMVVVGAPIAEEVFYRGFLQGALRKRGLPPAAAIGVSSVVFAAVHFQGLQFPALVLVGVLCGTLVHRTGRLGPAIAAHLAFNLVSVVSLLAS